MSKSISLENLTEYDELLKEVINIQYEEMPTASADTVGKVIQYTGTTTNDYTNGYFYKGISTTENNETTYSWSLLNVQDVSGKQDTLTFDSTPTQNSSNPVTSNGIYEALQNAGGGVTELVGTSSSSRINVRQWREPGIYKVSGYVSNFPISRNNATLGGSGHNGNLTKPAYFLITSSDVNDNIKYGLYMFCCTDNNQSYALMKSSNIIYYTNSLAANSNFGNWNCVNLKLANDYSVSTPSTTGDLVPLSLNGGKSIYNALISITGTLSNLTTTSKTNLVSAINELVSNKQNIIQYSTMPTASSSTVGKIVEYTGTTGTYTQGYFYIGTTDGTNYDWEEIEFGGGGSSTDVQINGTSVVSNGIANILTNTPYNSSTNKIATMSDINTVVGNITTILESLVTVEESV